eukprot:1208160-Prorocentrum_lima.AAC.1
MTSSLVGSEMCIRDRGREYPWKAAYSNAKNLGNQVAHQGTSLVPQPRDCLLYTSDAADDM